MKITILTQYWPPEMGAPQVRLSEFANQLMHMGWSVDVITALPNYPLGKIYDGFDPYRIADEPGPPRVIRVPLYVAQTGFLKRLVSYHSFALSAVINGARKLSRPDVLYVESPPLFLGFSALALQRIWRCPFVLNVSDLWPRSAVEMGYVTDGPWLRPAWALERQLYARAAGVTGQTNEIIDDVRKTSPRTRTLVVTNGVDPARFSSPPISDLARRIIGNDSGPVFLYAGLLGHAQGIDQILNAAKRLPTDVKARFVLVGDGPEAARLRKRVVDEEIHRVTMPGAVPRDEVPALLALSDAAVITLGVRLQGAVPSKIYEAMGAGKPIVLVAEGEAASRVRDANAGVVVDIGDESGLVDALVDLATNPQRRIDFGESGARAAQTTYNRGRIAETLNAFLRDSVAGNKASKQ